MGEDIDLVHRIWILEDENKRLKKEVEQLEEGNLELKEQHWQDYNIILNQTYILENNLCIECKRNIERGV